MPLKSKRVPISLAVFSTAFLTSTMFGSQTVSNDGMWAPPGRACVLMRQFSHDRGAKRTAAGAQQLRHRRQRPDAGARCAPRPTSSRCWPHPEYGSVPKFVLGGGSNIVLTGDVRPLVLKVEVPGRRLIEDGPRGQVVEAGAGENLARFP